jgi:hypothetical protein
MEPDETWEAEQSNGYSSEREEHGERKTSKNSVSDELDLGLAVLTSCAILTRAAASAAIAVVIVGFPL